jgi:uncharacterized delta-60 repeat protein
VQATVVSTVTHRSFAALRSTDRIVMVHGTRLSMGCIPQSAMQLSPPIWCIAQCPYLPPCAFTADDGHPMRPPVHSLLLLASLLFVAPHASRAQDGAIDTTFNPDDVGFDFGNGANGLIRTIVRQPDGRLLIGGEFSEVDGFQRSRIARLNSDGTVDETFDPTGTGGSTPEVYACVLQDDGKILIAGDFTSVNGTARGRIARLNSDGSLDASFATGAGANDVIRSLSLQMDGRVVIGGDFGSYAGTPRPHIARLNADGGLDTSFDPGSGASGGVIHAVLVKPDGGVLIGGTFGTYDGIPRSRVALLHDDGELDTLFNHSAPGISGGFSSAVDRIALQDEGKLILAGTFTSYNLVPINGLVRIGPYGIIDDTFTSGLGSSGGVEDIALLPDGRIIIAGMFFDYGGFDTHGIARLQSDGSFDPSYDPGDGPSDTMLSLALAPDGSMYAGGVFTMFNGFARGRAVHLDASGAVNLDFMAGSGADNRVLATLLQADGRIVIAGDLTRFNGQQRHHIARLMPNGELDMSFDPGQGVYGPIRTLALQPDGKILLGGSFTMYDGVPRDCIARINPDGSLDTIFNAGDLGNGVGQDVEDIIALPDGKILIGGTFNSVGGTSRLGIARLNSDGSVDTTFGQPYSGFDGSLYTMAVQPDGKIVVGGYFYAFDTTDCWYITRLNADGSLDPTFFNSIGTGYWVNALAVQPDGKILVGGHFETLHGVARGRIGRLNADGTVDLSFDPGDGVSPELDAPYVDQIELLPDGRIMIVGYFETYDGGSRRAIARLLTDGSLDPTFDPGTGPNESWIASMAVQPDGRIVIGGEFTAYDGTGRNRVARILSDLATAIPEVLFPLANVIPNPTAGSFRIASDQSGPLDVTVMDAVGRMVWREPRYLPGTTITLDKPVGCYLVSVVDGSHRTVTRLMKE